MENSKVYIYHIICIPTGKGYIGSTINIYKRKSMHFEQLNKNIHSNKYLQNAYNKYGKDSFDFKTIFSTLAEYRNKVEKWFINKSNYNTDFNLQLVDSRDYSIKSCFKTLKKCDIYKIFDLIKKEYSIKEIASTLKVSSNTIRIVIKGKYYADFKTPIKIQDLYIKNIINKKKKHRREKAPDVYVYTINGKFVNKYKSIPDTAEALSLNRNSVTNALQRGIQLDGYLFYRELKTFKNYIPNIHGTDLFVYDANFNLVESLKYMKKVQEKYNINVNTINSSCNRLQLCNKQFYFVREKDKQKFENKFNLNNEMSIRLLDNELNS